MSSRFSSFILKSAHPINESKGKVKSSTNSSVAPSSSLSSSTTKTGSKLKSSKQSPSPGCTKTSTKSWLKGAGCSSSFSKKVIPATAPKESMTPHSSVSDDLSTALVLKKKEATKSSSSLGKNTSKSSVSSVTKNASKSSMSTVVKNASKTFTSNKGNNEVTPSLSTTVKKATNSATLALTKKDTKSTLIDEKNCVNLTSKNSSEASNAIAKMDDSNSLKTSDCNYRGIVNPFALHSEGPLEIPEENFDFYSILARSKSYEIYRDEEDGKGIVGTADDLKIKSLLRLAPGKEEASSYAESLPSGVKPKESEIWGDLRASTAEESSSPPSLTSMVEGESSGEKKEEKMVAQDAKKVLEETKTTQYTDENNNVLDTIRNTIYRSFSFFEASRSSKTTTATISAVREIGENEREEADADYNVGKNRPCIFPTFNELDQVNSSERKINAQSSHNTNIHNSPTPLAIFLDSGNQDAISIPLDTEKKILLLNSNPSFEDSQLGCNPHHKIRHLCLETKLENGEVVDVRVSLPKENLPSLTKIQQPEEKIKDSSSLQLVVSGLKGKAVEATEESSHSQDVQSNNSERISPISSYTSATADEEFVYSEMVENSAEFDSQQTQTQSVDSHDMKTDTEEMEGLEKKEKLMRLAMAVNTGVDIAPLEEGKKAMRLRGIIKACRAESIHIDGFRTSSQESLMKPNEGKKRLHLNPQKISYPETFAQVGADYGFPADVSISGIIEKMVTMTWASLDEDDVQSMENVCAEKVSNSDTCLVQEGNRLIEVAYDIFSAGLKYASDLIGVEAELEPREDFICYNGYKIRVCGRSLLLESLHVNCDFNIDSNGNICCRSNRSLMKPSSASRAELEKSCEGRRIRIVTRLARPVSEVQDGEKPGTSETRDYTVCQTDGKWTFILENEENRDNFIEIGCPTGVHPSSLAYGLFDSILVVDAP